MTGETKKERLDKLVAKRGLATSLARAQRLIMAGRVLVEERLINKAGTRVPIDARLALKPGPSEFVSRGGEKLSAALNHFAIDVKGKVVLDVGASTGGFTHCLLLRGAAKIYAVDVGYGQLAWPLRQDPRVVVLERENARYLKKEKLKEEPELITIDVSFISLTKIIPNLLSLAAKGGELLALIKPQFELNKGETKKGVVRDPEKQEEAVKTIISFSQSLGLTIKGIFPSPLLGPKGNKEFFIYLRRPS